MAIIEVEIKTDELELVGEETAEDISDELLVTKILRYRDELKSVKDNLRRAEADLLTRLRGRSGPITSGDHEAVLIESKETIFERDALLALKEVVSDDDLWGIVTNSPKKAILSAIGDFNGSAREIIDAATSVRETGDEKIKIRRQKIKKGKRAA